MARGLAALALLGMVACSSITPVPVVAGDTCFRCRRPIVDARLAGQIIDSEGRAFKFRAPLCMAKSLAQHPTDLKAVFVTDYTTGKMFPAKNGMFVKITIDPDTREREYAAFRSATDAALFVKQHGGGTVDWLGVQRAAHEAGN